MAPDTRIHNYSRLPNVEPGPLINRPAMRQLTEQWFVEAEASNIDMVQPQERPYFEGAEHVGIITGQPPLNANFLHECSIERCEPDQSIIARAGTLVIVVHGRRCDLHIALPNGTWLPIDQRANGNILMSIWIKRIHDWMSLSVESRIYRALREALGVLTTASNNDNTLHGLEDIRASMRNLLSLQTRITGLRGIESFDTDVASNLIMALKANISDITNLTDLQITRIFQSALGLPDMAGMSLNDRAINFYELMEAWGLRISEVQGAGQFLDTGHHNHQLPSRTSFVEGAPVTTTSAMERRVREATDSLRQAMRDANRIRNNTQEEPTISRRRRDRPRANSIRDEIAEDTAARFEAYFGTDDTAAPQGARRRAGTDAVNTDLASGASMPSKRQPRRIQLRRSNSNNNG